ncbi:hypothetical protein IV203_011326 [Nitzschia inconspicua]|uniref:Uncharacterized protein n=1 Tax=Nitzschia inconspicua TaxID=303405 RepID=A0A9K3KSZ1_9STRA|nr:hypothetical protein IV203_011326 [Nitzschia inconspicua]
MAYNHQTLSSTTPIQFTRLETSILTNDQFRAWGDTKVPFLHINRNGACVTSFVTTFQILEQQLSETLQQCQIRSVTKWASFFRKHGHDTDRNKQARLQMQSQVLLLSSSCPQHQESSVYTLASEDQLFQALDSLESSTDDNTLLVTMFHSHFEQSCVRAQYRFRKIAQHYLSKPLKEFWCKDILRTKSTTAAGTATTSFSIHQNRSIGHFGQYSSKFEYTSVSTNSNLQPIGTLSCICARTAIVHVYQSSTRND